MLKTDKIKIELMLILENKLFENDIIGPPY